jgi:competence protein ComEC
MGGDVVVASGTIQPAEGPFDPTIAFPRYTVTGHEPGSVPAEAAAALRSWSLWNIERALPEPHASLAAGVLLGAQRTMPANLVSALRITGTTHLVVVSGQNIAIVLGAVVALLTAVMPRRRAGMLALLLLPGYVLLVGASAPVVRAAVMAVGIAIAHTSGRRTPAWIFLTYAAAGMLALDPALAANVSFQLSAAATAGVLLLAPPLTDAVVAPLLDRPWGQGLPAALVEAAVVSVSAAIAVTPVQAAAFHSASIVQVPANAAAALFYEGTLAVATVAALLGWLPPVAAAVHAVGQFAPGAFIAVVEAFARIPRASVPLRLAPTATVAWYLGVGVLLWLLARRTRGERALSVRTTLPVRTLGLAAVAGGLWLAALAPTDPLPSVTVLDGGQGLAVLVRDGASTVLVDTGPPDGAVLSALQRAGVSASLGAVMLTHDDADHIGGTTEVLRRLGATHVLGAPTIPRDFAPGLQQVDIGDRVTLTSRTSIEVISPAAHTTPPTIDGDNNLGLVVMVTIGERRILIPADIEAPTEHWLATSGLALHADALVVPHHGSATSSTPEFLAAVSPALAVVSVGEHNSYGHPVAAVLARYAGIPLYRTDQVGDVTIRTDGTRLWVSGQHAQTKGAQPTPRATVTPRTSTPTQTAR